MTEAVVGTEKKPAVKRRQCGTIAGYRQHTRRGEETCAECRAANKDYKKAHRAGEVKPRGESKAARREREERLGDELLGGTSASSEYPPFLKDAGRALWDAVLADFELSASGRVLLAEACRMKDRLERMSAALSSSTTLWFELGEPQEELDGPMQVQVVVNGMIGEARQLTSAIRQALQAIGVLEKAESKSSGGGVLDQLARKREQRLSAAEGGA